MRRLAVAIAIAVAAALLIIWNPLECWVDPGACLPDYGGPPPEEPDDPPPQPPPPIPEDTDCTGRPLHGEDW